VSDPDLLVTIGTIVRPHGFPREGVSYFKVSFDFPGHDTLPTQKTIWISEGAGHREIALAEAPAPLGGKWSQATGAKIALFDADVAALGGSVRGRSLALKRSSFASLSEGEVYLCDLFLSEVRDETGLRQGLVEGAVAAGKGAWNLVARATGAKNSFEFPLKWVDWSASKIDVAPKERFLVVPGVVVWINIEDLEGERDDDR